MNELPEPIPTSRKDGVGAPVEKLVPEWKVSGDDQIVVIGVAVFLLLLGGLGVSKWVGGDDDTSADPVVVEQSDDNSSVPSDLAGSVAFAAAATEVVEDAPATTDAPADEPEPVATEPEPEPDPEPVAEEAEPVAVDLTPDVAAAVGSYSRVVGTADGSTAVLAGYVDTDEQSTGAESAAAAVAGIESVDNQLVIVSPEAERVAVPYPGAEVSVTDGNVVLTGFADDDDGSSSAEISLLEVDGVSSVDNQLVALQPEVVAALDGAGVTGADASDVALLSATARGELTDESERQGALDAVAAVPGVVSVVDELTVAGPSVSDSLNALVELDPVQFGSSSSNVLDGSFSTLDEAAQIILAADFDGTIDVQGFTDIRGNDASNQQLSEDRAAAVVAYLIDAGVSADVLTSQGFGGTTQFGDGDTSEAYAANRRVQFVLNS